MSKIKAVLSTSVPQSSHFSLSQTIECMLGVSFVVTCFVSHFLKHFTCTSLIVPWHWQGGTIGSSCSSSSQRQILHTLSPPPVSSLFVFLGDIPTARLNFSAVLTLARCFPVSSPGRVSRVLLAGESSWEFSPLLFNVSHETSCLLFIVDLLDREGTETSPSCLSRVAVGLSLFMINCTFPKRMTSSSFNFLPWEIHAFCLWRRGKYTINVVFSCGTGLAQSQGAFLMVTWGSNRSAFSRAGGWWKVSLCGSKAISSRIWAPIGIF